MVLVREAMKSRQSHGLLVYVEPKQCGIPSPSPSSSLCESSSDVGFRYYQIDVQATDFAGNVGTASAYVVIVPGNFDADANSNPAEYFVRRIADSTIDASASYIIQTKEMLWDTTREDPPEEEGISVTTVQSVSAEMTISGLVVPANPAELEELIQTLQNTLNEMQVSNRRLSSEDCICSSEIRVVSIGGMLIGQRRQLSAGAVIVYEMVFVCDGNCEESTETEETDNVQDSTGTGASNTPSLKSFAESISNEIQNGNFVEALQENADEAGMESLVSSVRVESVDVDEDIRTSKETKAAVQFAKTVSFPVHNFNELDQADIESVITALNGVLKRIACVSRYCASGCTRLPY